MQWIAEVSGDNEATCRSADKLQDYFDEQRRVFSEVLNHYFYVLSANNDLYFCNSNKS